MIILLLTVIGLALGSFINAFVWRLHEKKNFVSERSICTNCKHLLVVKDLVPVISWLTLKGKCRYCSKKIHWQYPLVEAATALLFVASFLLWPQEFDAQGVMNFSFWLFYLVMLIALFIYDLKWMLLPNKITYVLLIVALVQVAINGLVFDKSIDTFVDAGLGFAIGGGIFYLLFLASGGKWIGGGDVKLGAFFGLLLGPWGAFITIFVASLIGSVVSLTLMGLKILKRKQPVPFGPFLITGIIVTALIGEYIIDWYTGDLLNL